MANRPQFVEGDWVFYFNPGHQWHMMMFQIKAIIPYSLYNSGGYELEYGGRKITAQSDQVLHRRDSRVPYEALNQSPFFQVPAIDTASGKQLDDIGALLGIERGRIWGNYEDDDLYRQRLASANKNWPKRTPSSEFKPQEVTHEGHEIVENWAGGNKFYYCRKCKVEVQKNEA